MIEIKKVTTARELKQFVDFPYQLYKENPYWVPPIKKDIISSFNPNNNIFKSNSAQFFLAYKSEKIVGRVVAIINWTEVNELKKEKIRFGWLDYEEDIEILKALLTKVENIGRENKLKYVEGPMGFSNMDKAGVLTAGFNEVATLIGGYHYPYYHNHLLSLGYNTAAHWIEYKFTLENFDEEKISKLANLIKNRYEVDTYNFKSIKEFMPYVDELFLLLNKTYANLQSFVPIEQEQINHYKNKYLKFIHPDFISCVKDKNGKMIAFAITMPSFSKAFIKAKGSLFPFGWWHLLNSDKKNTHVEFYLIGIDPIYQNRGLNALIFNQLYEVYKKRGIKSFETNPLLEENTKVQQLWKMFDPTIHKERKTFKKDIY